MFGIPRWNIALVVLLLAAMFGYASYFDTTTPERTVQQFYKSFDAGDYARAVDLLSVKWAYSVLFPRYNASTPAELVEKGAQVRTEMAAAFAEKVENGPASLEVTVLPRYTRTGELSAVVLYDYRVATEGVSGRQAALLVREEGKWRLFDISEVSEQDLPYLQSLDMSELDAGVAHFYAAQ